MKTFPYRATEKTPYAFITIVSFLAALLVVYQTSKFGPAVSPDSVNYLAAARSWANGKGMFSYSGPYVLWPPMFPLFLSLSEFWGISPYEFSRFLNSFSLAATVFVSGVAISKILKHKVLLYLGLCALVVSPTLMYVSVFVWSEPTFILFSSLCCLFLAVYAETKRKQALLVGALFCSLAIFTRYIGIVILPVGALIIAAQPKSNWAAKLRDVVLFGVIGSLPTTLWVLRNWLQYGVLTGDRRPSTISLIDAVASVVHTISGWLIPPYWPAGIHVALLGILLTLFVYYVYVEISSKQIDARKEQISYLAPYALFFGAYVVFFSYSASLVALGNIGGRFLSPVYVPFLITVLFVLDRVIASAEKIDKHLLAKSLIAILFGVWLIGYPTRHLYSDVDTRMRAGAGGYVTANWRNDELLKHFIENDLDGRIFSNVPDVIYFYTKKSASITPRKQGDNILDLMGAKDIDKKAYVVWINRKNRDYLYSLDEIGEVIDLKMIYKNSDGVIFEILGAHSS